MMSGWYGRAFSNGTVIIITDVVRFFQVDTAYYQKNDQQKIHLSLRMLHAYVLDIALPVLPTSVNEL
jgi:pantothenate synthetase